MKEEHDVVPLQRTCEIRTAQADDCEAIAYLARQLGYECSAEEVRKRLDDMQDATQYLVLVASLPEGQIAGWIGAYVFRSVETGSYGEISGLVVDQRIRSRGIGKTLLAAAEEWARTLGYDVISVRSHVMRNRAHRFYQRNGYENVKAQKEFHKSL